MNPIESADPKRRARSNDPGWKYGYWTEIGNRDKVTCNLCQTITAGRIKRLKEHLAGGYADTIMCSKTTTEIRKEMRTYLEKNKRNRPIFLDDDGGHGQQQQEEEGQVGTTRTKLLFSQARGQLLKGGEPSLRGGILLQQHQKQSKRVSKCCEQAPKNP
jgi:hypothetical protein